LSQATLAAFTFHDAAEVFVLLAGYSAMLAYHRGFAGGMAAGAAPIFKRVGTIFQTQVALALLLVVMGLALATVTGRAFYMEHLELADFAAEPVRGTFAIFALLYQPSYADILPMYVVLMAALPLVIAGLVRSPLVTLAVSLSLYAVANVVGVNLPQVFENTWFFNPFTWQLIFVVGAAAAHATLTGVRLPRHVDGVILSAAIVGFAVAVKAPWTALGFDGGLFTTLGVNYLDFSKTWVHPLRLAALLALAYLIAVLVSPRTAWLASPWALRVQALGKASLPAFALGTVLSFLGAAALTEFGAGLAVVVAINATGFALLLALPVLLQDIAKPVQNKQAQITPALSPAPAQRSQTA
jgi:hypothetical protein